MKLSDEIELAGASWAERRAGHRKGVIAFSDLHDAFVAGVAWWRARERRLGSWVGVLHTMHAMAAHSWLSDEQKATLLIQTIDEAEQLLGPIQQRLSAKEDAETRPEGS